MPFKGFTRVIAVEEHFLTDEYIQRSAGLPVREQESAEKEFEDGFVSNPEMRRRMTDMPTRLREMDAAGVDVAVLSLNPPGVQLYDDPDAATALASQVNDELASLVREHPNRFFGLGCVAPQDPDRAAQEIRRIMGPLGFGGVMINSHTLGRYLDEPEFEPILDTLEKERATLYLHPRVPSPQMLEPYSKYGMLAAIWGFQAEAGTHAIRLIMSGVFDRHPGLKVVLGHCGEALPFWMWRLDNITEKTFRWAGDKLGMVKLQKKPTEYLRENFAITTSGMDDPDALLFCVGKLGAENIMFAVDYPYEENDTAVEFLAATRLSVNDRDLISHLNAERLFRVPSGERQWK